MGEDKHLKLSKSEEAKQELSYDKLKEIANQLHEQNKMLITQLQKFQNENLFKRIDYLFKVVENEKFFSSLNNDFLIKCGEELTTILTIPEEVEGESIEK